MNRGWLDGMVFEWRRALRGLGRSPGFAAGVILILGVTVAGAVTVATAAYELFLRPLPFTAPGQLVQPSLNARSMGFEFSPSPPMLPEIREMPMVADLAAYDTRSPAGGGEGGQWQRAEMTPGTSALLGLSPVLGRGFDEADAAEGAVPVALVGERVWRTRFGGDESLIGREIRLDDRRLTVVGVLPASFRVPSQQTEIWEPLGFSAEQMDPGRIGSFSSREVIVRLRPGATAAQFQAALRARYEEDERLASARELMGLEFNVKGLREAWTADQRRPLAIIGLASLLVLAVAVLNIAGLWLARLLGRSHEQAVQAALGAGRWRGLGRTVFELLALGLAGGAVAMALVPWALDWLRALEVLPTTRPLVIGTGAATVVATMLVLIVCTVPVIGAAWWQLRRQRRDVAASLAGGGRGHAGSGARVRRVLIVAQIALAMSLLSAMTLLLRSWHGLLTEDLGFEPQRLLVSRVNPADRTGGLAASESDPRVSAALAQLRGLPGVTAAGHTNTAPFDRSESISTMPVPGQPDRETNVRMRWAGAHFFRAAGMDFVAGRAFDREGGENQVVVDQLLASRYFPGGAVGKALRLPSSGEYSDMTIVGVVETVKSRSPDEKPDRGTVFRFRREPHESAALLVAAGVDPSTLIGPVEAALERSLGPERVGNVVTMDSLVRRTVRDREPQLLLLGVFAAETLVLAGFGLFSLLAYSVRARTAEFGVRQAVGASPGRIRRHVLGDAVRLLVPGLAIGIAGAILGGYLVADRLYEIGPLDPATWLMTASVLALVVFTAGLWPARRASRIRPVEALRYE